MSELRYSLFQNKTWRISRVTRKDANPYLFVENLLTGFCDYPIKYDNGQIAYDFPERLPKYVKKEVAKAI